MLVMNVCEIQNIKEIVNLKDFIRTGTAGIDQHIFQTLVEGQRRANQTEYCNVPAQLNMVMYDAQEPEQIELV